MKVVPYDPKYKNEFVAMNKAWIEELFVLEPEDVAILENVQALIDKGGEIFFTLDDDGKVLACCMLETRSDVAWEIAKFNAKNSVQNKGAGTLCFKSCLDCAKEKNIPELLIVSNTKCAAGIHLYKKFGFEEIPVDKKLFPYEQANIAFKKSLT